MGKALKSDKKALNILQQTVAVLQKEIDTKDAEIIKLKKNVQALLEQFQLARQARFGVSSESSRQLGLFNEAESILDDETDEDHPDIQTITYERKKPVRKPLPEDLPRETIIHDLDDDEKCCGTCGHDLHQMGEEKHEKLRFIPAQVSVIEHIRLKYSCRHCEKHETKVTIKTAPLPPSPIPKSIATASLLAHIICNKYQYALPLYRQESLFKQYGIALNRKTLSSWMMKSADMLLPICERLKQIQHQQNVIFADETPLKVIHEDKIKCYMWVYCTGTDGPINNQPITSKNIVIYDYHASRSGQCAIDYLQGYAGYLQVDGYAAYGKTNAILVGCFSHARRKFTDAKKLQPKGKTGKADIALGMIQKLYRIETEIKTKSPEDKLRIRQEKSAPLLKKYKQWLDKSALQVPPKSAIGKAIAYNLNQWHKLVRYIENGELNIDNNRAERAIKPFVIGRKNWLFSNTSNGAKASAILYSLTETAKANGLVPFDYLRYLFQELSKKPEDIESLMPWCVVC